MHGWHRHEYTAVCGTRVHAAEYGPAQAPAVVCVHGLGASHRVFLPLARQLAPDFQTVAVDLPGFGYTRGYAWAADVRETTAALAAWLRATGRAGAVLVGDSTGCQVVVDSALVAPDLPGPVVLVGPTFDRRARTVWQQGLRLAASGLVDRPGPGTALRLLRDRYDAGTHRWPVTFARWLHDPIERKLPWVLPPAAVVRGAQDLVVPQRWAEELVDGLPDGRLVTVAGAGHAVDRVAPEVTAAVVRQLAAEYRTLQDRLASRPAPTESTEQDRAPAREGAR